MIESYRKLSTKRSAVEGQDEGFTLIELLIVIVVLGILAAIVVFALSGVTGQSTQAACQSDAKTVGISVAALQAENPRHGRRSRLPTGRRTLSRRQRRSSGRLSCSRGRLELDLLHDQRGRPFR